MKSRAGRRGFRFQLQTMLVLVTAFAIALGLVTHELHREHRKKQNAEEVRRLGGNVHYNRRPRNEPTGIVNGYLRIFLGDEHFTEVDSVTLKRQKAGDLNLLHSFPEMKRLSLDGAPVTDDSLERLRGLSQLESLYISGAVLDGSGLKALKGLPELRALHLEDCSLADQSLKSLTEFPKLRSLELTNCLMSDELLKSLTQSSIVSLAFKNCSLTDAHLRSWHGARSEVKLSLVNTDVTEAGIVAIREANPIWSVRFSGKSSAQTTRTDIKGYLPSIQEMPQIDELTFQGALTSDATLAVLTDAQSLASLEFFNCPLTDGGLKHLTHLKNLQSLKITGASVTDDGTRALEELTNLRVLHLAGTKIEGLRLGYLPSSITTLGVSSSEVTDRGVAEIAKLSSLEELYLMNTLVSDGGIDHLAKMTSLRKLYLLETPISDSGVSRLQRALPNCVIFTE